MSRAHSRFLLLLAFSVTLGCHTERSAFVFNVNEQGVELREDGQSVFFYQKEPKSRDGQYICSNYLHPLYSIKGDTLTEEFPDDHPFHRGIFWAWHQLYISDQTVGDGWVMENITLDVDSVSTRIQNSLARLTADVHWKSALWQDSKPFVHEQTTILVHPRGTSMRIIDFEISLRALVPGVSIGGSDDEKGYGGFCTRIRMPEDLAFTSVNGPVIPQNLQIEAGSWMDFSATFGRQGQSGLTILCHPGMPNYPAPWILRQTGSMQNIVFPGRQRITLPIGNPVVLRYRLIVHEGSALDLDMKRLQAEYAEFDYPNSGPQIRN
jgi:hypothetical protein